MFLLVASLWNTVTQRGLEPGMGYMTLIAIRSQVSVRFGRSEALTYIEDRQRSVIPNGVRNLTGFRGYTGYIQPPKNMTSGPVIPNEVRNDIGNGACAWY